MRSLIILLILCIGLGGFIYFQERHMPTTDEIKKEDKLLFHKLNKDNISYIKIKKDGKELILEKKDNKWVCEGKPVKEYKINSLVSSIASYRYRYEVGLYDKARDKEYGFDKPSVEAEFTAADKSFRIVIGADTPLGGNKYILLGNRVYVGSGYPFTSQAMDAKSWQKEEKKKQDKNDKPGKAKDKQGGKATKQKVQGNKSQPAKDSLEDKSPKKAPAAPDNNQNKPDEPNKGQDDKD